ncbi:MAG: radical SAM protein [Candidatus Latescibacteria bacterium]|nr:radical SAM protein [Candidatus Latescibacterota bacterium]
MSPGYLELYKSGELLKRKELLFKHYTECSLCPHTCKVNRISEKGICRSGSTVKIASYNSHHGEEPPISGINGSGTIFFSGCNGRCIFCQNYPISQLNTGKEVTDAQLAAIMIELQCRGCHNINLVTPTHFLPSIVHALAIASEKGLHIPIVYNSSGYARVEIIQLLDGIIDIYLPDIKYADNTTAYELSGFKNYVDHNRVALKEMYKQVGKLKIVDNIAVKGLLVRHLVLPDNLAGTDKSMEFLSREISHDLHISFMDQYFPAYKAINHEKMSRRISEDEYNISLDFFYASDLHNGWIQQHLEQ